MSSWIMLAIFLIIKYYSYELHISRQSIHNTTTFYCTSYIYISIPFRSIVFVCVRFIPISFISSPRRNEVGYLLLLHVSKCTNSISDWIRKSHMNLHFTLVLIFASFLLICQMEICWKGMSVRLFLFNLLYCSNWIWNEKWLENAENYKIRRLTSSLGRLYKIERNVNVNLFVCMWVVWAGIQAEHPFHSILHMRLFYIFFLFFTFVIYFHLSFTIVNHKQANPNSSSVFLYSMCFVCLCFV